MDGWGPEYGVLRQRRKELWREAEGRRLISALRSRNASRAPRRPTMLRGWPRLFGDLSPDVGAWISRSNPADEEESRGWSG